MGDETSSEDRNEVRYTIRLKQPKHEKWSEFVEEDPAINNLSELIRIGVEEHIQRTRDEEEGMSKEQKETIDIIRQEFGRVMNVAEEIQDTAERIDDQMISPQAYEEITYDSVSRAVEHTTEGSEDE